MKFLITALVALIVSSGASAYDHAAPGYRGPSQEGRQKGYKGPRSRRRGFVGRPSPAYEPLAMDRGGR